MNAVYAMQLLLQVAVLLQSSELRLILLAVAVQQHTCKTPARPAAATQRAPMLLAQVMG